MEFTANALSPEMKPIIVATSPTSIATFPPGGTLGRDWLVAARIGHGAFTIDADKTAIGPILCDLITTRKALALTKGDLTFYRTLHAASAWLLDGCGIEVPEEPFDEWMAAMHFSTANDDARSTGLTPLIFAVMTGRADLVEALIDLGASTECVSKVAEPSLQIEKGSTALSVAACVFRILTRAPLPSPATKARAFESHARRAMARDGTIIELLLRHGADPRRRIGPFGLSALFHAVAHNNIHSVRAFMRHDKTLAAFTSYAGYYPFGNALLMGHAHLASTLKDEYPQEFEAAVLKHDLGLFANSIVSTTIINGISSIEVFEAALDAGEPVDRFVSKCTKGPIGTIVKIADLVAWLRPVDKLPSFIYRFAYLARTTALHCAASQGKLTVVNFLLGRGAPINSTANPKGMTPLHLAIVGDHLDIIARLLGAGADSLIKDKRGRTALALATKLRRDAVRTLLTGVAKGEPEGDAPAGSKARGASKYKVAPAPPILLHEAEVARDEAAAEWRVAEQGSSSADQ